MDYLRKFENTYEIHCKFNGQKNIRNKYFLKIEIAKNN